MGNTRRLDIRVGRQIEFYTVVENLTYGARVTGKIIVIYGGRDRFSKESTGTSRSLEYLRMSDVTGFINIFRTNVQTRLSVHGGRAKSFGKIVFETPKPPHHCNIKPGNVNGFRYPK